MTGDAEGEKRNLREELLYIFEELCRRGDITKEELETCRQKLAEGNY